MCHKLRQLGITGDILKITMLGPLLFLILMHNIDARVESDVISYADDTRIYRGVNDVSD